MSARLELREVALDVGGRRLLDSCSLAVAAGEMLVICGPSGSGKSTLLRAIAGLSPVASGAILIDGQDVTALEPGRRGVGMVFQSYALFPHLSVADNLGFGLRARGVARAEIDREVRAMATTLGLQGVLQRRPGELSGGERQRLALGRALLRKPTVLLMDEPLSNVDAQLRAQLRAEILALHRATAAAIIYVTHDQQEALALADRLAIVLDGRVAQIDTPQAVYEQPGSLAVARFLGDPAMNLVEASRADGRLRAWGAEFPTSNDDATAWLGVRPESIAVEGSRWQTLAEGPWVEALIERRELRGDQWVLQTQVAGQALALRVEKTLATSEGQRLRLRLPARPLRFAADGRRLDD